MKNESDGPSESEEPERPAGDLPSARGSGPSPPRPARAGRRELPKKPTPVRALAESTGAESATTPEVERAELTVEGAVWSAEVLGRTIGGRGCGPHLMLVGFRRGEASDGEVTREALIPGRALADLSDTELEAAWAESTTPTGGRGPAPFFEDTRGGR